MLRLVLFDIDGTLIAERDEFNTAAWVAGISGGLGLFGVRPEDVPHVGFTDWATAMALAAFYAIPLAEREKRVAQVLQIKDEHLVRLVGANPARHPLRPVPGARALVRALARAGVSLGIVSGNTAIAALLKLQRGGFRPVDFCVVSSGGRLADRADIVAVALNAIRAKLPDLRPAEILVVGDTLADIAAGRRHGTHTLAVVSDRMSAAALAAGGPDLLVEAFPPLRVLLESLFGAENEGRSETEHPAASPRPS